MTTEAAARLYLANHLLQWQGRPLAVHNPNNLPVKDLPVIYGFNNGGSPGWFTGVLLAEDGQYLGGHVCSEEGYMPHDLGCLEGSRLDRHEDDFQKKYPEGYRMEFVSFADIYEHAGIQEVYRLNQLRRKEKK